MDFESGENNVGLYGSKKRKRDPETRKDNKRKTVSLEGEAYVSTSGRTVAPKTTGSSFGPPSKSDELLVKIREHIECFPRKITHYASQVQQYLDARLNVKTMHYLFIKENPELQHTVKYEFYLKYFKENYALRFGRPQVDACSECERSGAKIRSKSLNANAKRVATAELIVHKRRAQNFHKKLQNVQNLCQERLDVAGITFDFIQNLPLSNIPVQKIFYFLQLWVYAFEIHNLSVRGHSFLPCDRDFGTLKNSLDDAIGSTYQKNIKR
nr:unnamed protein product [Callosobruchus chinensis]